MGERWSTFSEIRRSLSSGKDQGGPILYCSNHQMLKYTGEGHAIYVGSSGSGKSRRGTIAMAMSFIEAEESFVFADPKGEIYNNTASLLPQSYKKIVLDFRNVFESAGCNILAPVAELYLSGDPANKQAAMEQLDHIAHALYPDVAKDPFWNESARSVFIGATCALMECAEPEQINILNVVRFISKGDERFGAESNTFLKEFVKRLPENSTAALELHSYITTASETRGGIRSTFLQGLSKFVRSDGIAAMMSNDDVHINQLDGETPTAIYVIVPDETPIYDSICGIIINEVLTHYVRIAQTRYGGCLPRRLNVCLEELGNIGHAIPNLPHLMTAGRSRNIRCQLVLQSFSQLNALYGAANANTILENASVLVAYRSNHWDTLSELSRMCGEKDVDMDTHTVRKNLITPADLNAMQVGQALVKIAGGIKFITWLPDFTEMFDCSRIRPPERQSRVDRKAPELFDVCDYVKNIKRAELEALMATPCSDDSPPRFVMPSFNPFSFPLGEEKKQEENNEDELLRGSIADLISEIDAKIKELDEEDKAAKPYGVTLISCKGERPAVIRILRRELELNIKEICDVMKNLPHQERFADLDKARSFAEALKKVGAEVETEGF